MHRDFDSFANDEVAKTPHTFTFHGETYEFPSDIPYFTKLRMARLYSKGMNAAVAGKELYEILQTVLGETQLTKLEAAQPSDEQGTEILKYIFDVWNNSDDPSPNVPVKRGKVSR